MKPLAVEPVPVAVGALTRVELDALADTEGSLVLTAQRSHRWMVGVGRDAPIHARREVVLDVFAPAPERGVVGRVTSPVDADDAVGRVLEDAVAPLEAASPASPRGTFGVAQAVRNEIEEGDAVDFQREARGRVQCAQRPVGLYVFGDPCVGNDLQRRARVVVRQTEGPSRSPRTR